MERRLKRLFIAINPKIKCRPLPTWREYAAMQKRTRVFAALISYFINIPSLRQQQLKLYLI